MSKTKIDSNRELLTTAQSRGALATLMAYGRLSGPGWLQSAITLGGGSLGGALYLGMLSGTGMLWLQLVAITIGVIMLAAISYVTLSTGKRPYLAINEHINPVLGVGWVTATILANLIFILPQFSLCYDSVQTSLGQTQDSTKLRIVVSAVIGLLAFGIVAMNCRPGRLSIAFDILLKLLVGFVVVCFVAVVVSLTMNGSLDWGRILYGFVPNLAQWSNPSIEIQRLTADMPDQVNQFWTEQIVANQQSSMVSVTATAVGLNMTFLLPYSLLARGWDKPFRGLARFDLIGALAIPFIVVTSCIVIASAYAFHAKADESFLSDDPEVVQTSTFFDDALGLFSARLEQSGDAEAIQTLGGLNEQERRQWLADYAVSLTASERKVLATLIKPNSRQLADSLAPLLGQNMANLVFGLGALAMAFSTIIILMMINGFAVAEIFSRYDNTMWRLIGAFIAMLVGMCWWLIWKGESRTWLIVVASTFGAILLPIAYISFLALMNNRNLLGSDKPTGASMWIWNLLMILGVLGALVQAIAAMMIRVADPLTGGFVIGSVVAFVVLALVGFSARNRAVSD